LDNLSFQYIVPELVLTVFAILLLVLGMVSSNRKLLGLTALLGIVLSLFILSYSPWGAGPVFSGMLIDHGLSMYFRVLSLIIGGLVILLSMDYKDLDTDEKGEYYFFILIVTLFMMVASASANLMMIYITLEAISLLSYILAGYLKRDMFSSEAGIKYFLYGALSTGVTLYGISLIYGLFGTLDLAAISGALFNQAIPFPMVLLASLLILTGFGFKCSLVPFHMWTPDVYQGAPTPVAAFFSVGPKAVGFVFLLRVFAFTFLPVMGYPGLVICSLIAAMTITVGNVVAVKQDNIKRLLAYSTIAQAGYIFIGLTAGSFAGVQAILYYVFVYALMNLGAFGVVIAVSNAIKSDRIEDYAGLYQRAPRLAVILAISLFSLGGIPPLAGFFAKFFIFASALSQGLVNLVIIAALNSVIALYYYVRILKFAFLHEPTDTTPIPQPKALMIALGLVTFGIILFGIWPQGLLGWGLH